MIPTEAPREFESGLSFYFILVINLQSTSIPHDSYQYNLISGHSP